jgi:hypothetical protein
MTNNPWDTFKRLRALPENINVLFGASRFNKYSRTAQIYALLILYENTDTALFLSKLFVIHTPMGT